MTTMFKIRINSGSHVDENQKRHLKGSTFLTKNNLVKHNLPGERRFEMLDKIETDNPESEKARVDSESQNEDPVDEPILDEGELDLEVMSVKQLKEFASENDVYLGKKAKKEDIIETIELALNEDA